MTKMISLRYRDINFLLPTKATSGEIEEKADGFITSSQQVVVYFMAIKNHSLIILSSTLEHKYIRVLSLTPRCSSVLKSFAPSARAIREHALPVCHLLNDELFHHLMTWLHCVQGPSNFFHQAYPNKMMEITKQPAEVPPTNGQKKLPSVS
jgi:hypothetical protein